MFRSGFVAIVGRPNVGKSTLLNKLVGQKIAIESPVVQTTRHRIKGVVTSEKGQIIFLDTPGFATPIDQLGQYLTQEGEAALAEADAFIFVVDLRVMPGKGDEWVINQVRKTGKYILMVMNKADAVKKPATRAQHRDAYKKLLEGYDNASTIQISAKTGKNISKLADMVIRKLPEGPAYYDEEALTDQRLREISAEIIREKILLNTREEIPHSVAVAIERFEEIPGQTKIYATLYVDQKSQKGILIGAKGSMIKTIGTEARKDIEKMMDTPLFLELSVKVRENWRKDPKFLESLGLAPPG